MSGPNAMDDEMSGFSFPGRPGDEPLLDMVFDRCPLPPEAPAEIHGLAQLLVALAGPAEPGELAGEAAARGAFTRVASPAGVLFPDVRPAGRRRRSSQRPGRGRAAKLGPVGGAYGRRTAGARAAGAPSSSCPARAGGGRRAAGHAVPAQPGPLAPHTAASPRARPPPPDRPVRGQRDDPESDFRSRVTAAELQTSHPLLRDPGPAAGARVGKLHPDPDPGSHPDSRSDREPAPVTSSCGRARAECCQGP
jgi:hypothetical protein